MGSVVSNTIRGVHEPFKPYVQAQLYIRRAIIGGGDPSEEPTIGIEIEDLSYESEIIGQEWLQQQIQSGMFTSELMLGSSTGMMSEINVYDLSENRGELFFTYTTQKQAIIRLASGVDVRHSAKNQLLESGESYLVGSNLARHYILEGGIKPMEEGPEGEMEYMDLDTYDAKFGDTPNSYGDKDTRGNPTREFGAVPMPGIVDAHIRTKSDDGSLREALVNFKCHNKRQLEVLETLYMRPGYPLLLEWGWDPYIANPVQTTGALLSGAKKETQRYNKTVLEAFFDPGMDFNDLNNLISLVKQRSSGNYDGFIGYVKNFSYKAREDGGYNCSTELMAQGEILESFKAKKVIVSKDVNLSNLIEGEGNIIKQGATVEDSFSFYLKAIKFNTDKAGDAAFLKYMKAGETYSEDKTYKIGENEESITIKELNRVIPEYQRGFNDILDMYQDVQKLSESQLEKDISLGNPVEGQGIRTMLGGTILREIAKYDGETAWWSMGGDFTGTNVNNPFTTGGYNFLAGLFGFEEKIPEIQGSKDSGYRKSVYVRWDLLCQIINQLCQDAIKDSRKTKSSKAQQYEEQVGRKLQVPIAELTYMGPNQKTVSNQNSSAGSSKIPPADWISENPEGKFYLSYSPPECKDNDPACKAILKQQADGMTDNHHARLFDVEGYHPILGSSIDPGICIMPHEPKLNMIVAGGMTYVDPQADLQLNPLVDTPYPELPNIQAYETWKSQQKELVKHNYDLLSSYEGVANQRHSIGLVYFNLNYLLTEYESMRYKVESQIADENKDPNQKTRVKVLRDDFSMFEFLDKIWKDVSKSCGNYYNFTLTTEHERPHVARVIDRTLSGYPKGEMFKFDPQGNYSITRDFEFSSKIDNDFADVVSIAAQSPSSINSLEAMSFKAFHKHIKSRFSDGSVDHQTEIAQMEEAKQKLKRDIQDYKHIVEQLYILLIRIQTGNFVTKLPWEKKTPEENQYIGTQTAVNYQAKLSELLNSIQSRYPLSDPRAGLYKSESSLNRNAVIPLTFSIKLDGISGILPLQLFQIKSNKLPEAYRSNKIAFIVSKEEHKITAGQDWETSIEGQLTMLNSYDGILGINEWEVEDHIEDYDGSTENELDGIEGDEGSPIPTGYNGSGLANPVHDWPADQNDIYFSSPWGRKRGPNVRHKGVDIAVASGTVVYSPAGGTVMEAFLPEDAGTGCGGTMTIKHDNGIKTRFCHLKEVYWTQGQTISGIMQIGLSGGAVGDIGRGSSEGAHLHYEVYANGTAWETPLPDWWPANVYTGTTDPAPFMAQANVSTYGTNPYGDN